MLLPLSLMLLLLLLLLQLLLHPNNIDLGLIPCHTIHGGISSLSTQSPPPSSCTTTTTAMAQRPRRLLRHFHSQLS